MTEPAMKPLGKIPSPYGTMIEVFFDRSRHVDKDECYFHNVEGCMDIAGVYGRENRDRCEAEIKSNMPGRVTFDIFLKHGGRTVPREPLPRPATSAFQKFDWSDDIKKIADNWVTLAMDYSDWQERSKAMLSMAIGPQLDGFKDWMTPPQFRSFLLGLSVGHLITAALEHLPDTEIDCLEAAAFYALTLHEEWTEPAIRWLKPFKDTWFRDWIKAHPIYRDCAKHMVEFDDTRPKWLAGK